MWQGTLEMIAAGGVEDDGVRKRVRDRSSLVNLRFSYRLDVYIFRNTVKNDYHEFELINYYNMYFIYNCVVRDI